MHAIYIFTNTQNMNASSYIIWCLGGAVYCVLPIQKSYEFTCKFKGEVIQNILFIPTGIIKIMLLSIMYSTYFSNVQYLNYQ
jgi:hypothetical protein